MLKIKGSRCFLCMVLLIVSSCSTNDEITAINTPPEENIFLVAPSQAPTSEEILALPETSEPLPTMKTQCASEISESQNLDLPGVIVLKQSGKKVGFQATNESGQLPNLDFGFYLFDPNKEQPIKSISEGLLEQVSPDGKYVAYVHYDSSGDQKFLGTLDSSGELVNDFSLFLDGGWQSYFNWQNSKQIRIVAAYGTVETRLLDPLTKLHSPLKNDWADASSPANPYKDKIADWKFDRRATKTFDVYGANILYDPTLTRVFYPKDDEAVSLVNVGTETELASAQFTD